MICKKCGAEFDGAFCPKCGERAEEKLTVCPVCGRERAEGENFCAKCGYAFERQATVTQKPQAKITFDKEALIGGVRKFYKVALNIGKVFFSLLLLLILASPIMLHEGINTAGNGYTNAFNLYVDGRFTAVCAILMIIAFYSLIYGVYSCVKNFVFHNSYEGWISYIFYFGSSLMIFIVSCIGCSGAGEWFANAGAGLSFGIFVGIVGMALSVLRFIFEDKFLAAGNTGQEIEVSEAVKKIDKKVRKRTGQGTIIVTLILIVAVVITSIVQSVYTNPFSSASYGFAETRADVIKQFGMPENAKEDSASYTYYSTEYAAADRMIDALIAAQDKHLTDGFESDADSFDEDDFESMFDGAMGIDGIIEKLEEKKENEKYKKSVVTFNSDGGDDRNNDTVKSYVCEVISPEVDGEEKEERTLTQLKIKNGYYFSYDGSAEFEYLAKYSDGSFSGGKIALNVDSYDEDKNIYMFNDSLGEYTVSANELETIEGEVYVRDDILYIVGNTSNALANLSFDSLNKIKKIEIKQGVTSVEYSWGNTLSNLEEISAPDSLVCFSIRIIKDSKFYNDASNWENGKVLYIGNLLAEAKVDLSGDYTVREGTTAINENAFEECVNLTSITIPGSVTSIGEYSFYNCSSLTIYCEAASELSGWDSNWNYYGYPVVWDCNNNDVASDGYIYYIAENGIRYALKDGCAIVARQSVSLSGDIEIPSSISYKGNAYVVTSIGEYAFKSCSSLTSITIPDGVTSIGSSAFEYCFSLTSITIPGRVTSIDSYTFYWCSSLTSVTIPDGVTSIGDHAFEGCGSLTSITIPDSVTIINVQAFTACSSLTSITIPDSVTRIGECAFWLCSSLTSVTIPDSVTSIGEYAFSDCSSLTSVIFENTQDWWYSSSSWATSGTSISSSGLADPATAAEYLTDTYVSYYWKRG